MFNNDIDYQKRGCFEKDEQNKMNNCITNSTKLLNSLIEANEDMEIFNSLNKSLDFYYIRSKLASVYKYYVENTLKLPISSSVKTVNKYIKEDNFEGDISKNQKN